MNYISTETTEEPYNNWDMGNVKLMVLLGNHRKSHSSDTQRGED